MQAIGMNTDRNTRQWGWNADRRMAKTNEEERVLCAERVGSSACGAGVKTKDQTVGCG
jgi:hypothetical protein